jgi:hypothetical protein
LYFYIFGCDCYILNTKDSLRKFDTKSDKGIFLGYSLTSKAYKVYNLSSKTVQESTHVLFNKISPSTEKEKAVDAEEDQSEINLKKKITDMTDSKDKIVKI